MESIKQTILTDTKVKIKYFDKKHKIRITLDDNGSANHFFIMALPPLLATDRAVSTILQIIPPPLFRPHNRPHI
jgi:hypothetical protein